MLANLLDAFLFIPIGLQGLAMVFDEFYFHRKRGLPKWERLGHPLDTLSVLLCYAFITLRPPTDGNTLIYIGLCSFSCLLITKDEFVHAQLCCAKENWLHAILFILHPVTFFAAALLWRQDPSSPFLAGQSAIVLAFMIYQLLYWSVRGEGK